jgi:hypothetical protein
MLMKRILLTAAFLGTVAAGGLVAAQAPAPAAAGADDHAAHHAQPAKAGAPAMSPGAKTTEAPAHSEGMMGGGMCSHMMGGMGAVMGAPGTKVDVKKTDKGVTINLTAPDAVGAARLQKMAEAMRLMHEAMGQ